MADDPSEKSHTLRKVFSWVLVVLASILAATTVVSVWTRNQITDTDRFVRTVAPLAENEAIQEEVATQVGDAIVSQLDVEAFVTENVPGGQFIAAPLAAAFEGLIDQTALRFIQSDAFSALWEQAARTAHTAVAAVVTGKDEGAIQTIDGVVRIELQPVAKAVIAELQERSDLALFDQLTGDRVSGSIVLLRADELGQIQEAVGFLDTLAFWLPIAFVLCAVGALVLGVDRRKVVIRLGIGVAIAMTVVSLGLATGRYYYLEALTPNLIGTAAGEAIYDILVTYLRLSLRIVLAAALGIAVAAILLGPSRGARAVRGFVGRNPLLTAGLVVLAAFGVLVLLEQVTPTAFWATVIVAAIVIVFLEVIGAREKRSPVGASAEAA